MTAEEKKARKCLFCRSVNCYDRIVAHDMSYDELACKKHSSKLSEHADQHVQGKKRCVFSTSPQQRGMILQPIKTGMKYTYKDYSHDIRVVQSWINLRLKDYFPENRQKFYRYMLMHEQINKRGKMVILHSFLFTKMLIVKRSLEVSQQKF